MRGEVGSRINVFPFLFVGGGTAVCELVSALVAESIPQYLGAETQGIVVGMLWGIVELGAGASWTFACSERRARAGRRTKEEEKEEKGEDEEDEGGFGASFSSSSSPTPWTKH